MCHHNKTYLAAWHPTSSTPSSPSKPSPTQLVTLLQGMSRSDWRTLKHEVKAEKRAIKAEMKAYKHELRADSGLCRRERKAMKHAALAQLWGDVVSRQVERITSGNDGQGAAESGVMEEVRMGEGTATAELEYQTLRENGRERGMGSPPRYEEVVEREYVEVKA